MSEVDLRTPRKRYYDNHVEYFRANSERQRRENPEYFKAYFGRKYTCELCQVEMSWNHQYRHNRYEVHLDNVERVAGGLKPIPVEKKPENERWYCEACDVELANKSKYAHLKSAKHANNVEM